MSTLSLIICTRHRPGEVSRLLEALAVQRRRPDEILVVDASPDRATRVVVQSRGDLPGLRYLRVPDEHRGLTRQRNYGIDRASGDVIAFLDDDTVPEPGYFAALLGCLDRHPDAVGAGGWISDRVPWRRCQGNGRTPLRRYRFGNWERRDDLRWVLRRCLGLGGDGRPGAMPPSGHGRSVGYLPPDGADHEVEFVMGGASAWRRELFVGLRFDPGFEGYGLYEDLDFCIDARRRGRLLLCTRARLAHRHAPAGRPPGFDYGRMVVVNGWQVWRKRWPRPPASARLRWWATTLLLAGCRFGDALRGPARSAALSEACGRLWGAGQLVLHGRSPQR